MSLKYIFLFYGVMALGCSTINRAYTDDFGRLTPVKPKFRLNKELSLNEVDLPIRTDVVYLAKKSGILSNSNDFNETDYWVFKRFLPNGEYYSSNALDHEPDKFDFTAMTNGYKGYWKLVNDSTIRVEFFSPKEFNCYILKDYAIHQDGRIYPIKSRIRSFGAMWKKYDRSYLRPLSLDELPDSIPS